MLLRASCSLLGQDGGLGGEMGRRQTGKTRKDETESLPKRIQGTTVSCCEHGLGSEVRSAALCPSSDQQ